MKTLLSLTYNRSDYAEHGTFESVRTAERNFLGKMKDCKVNILGTEYTITYKNVDDDAGLKEADGYCDPTSHEIVIRKNNVNELGDFEELQKRSLRHELVHAMLFESGLGHNFQHVNEYGHDETIVDWFAIQSTKIYKIFTELNLL